MPDHLLGQQLVLTMPESGAAGQVARITVDLEPVPVRIVEVHRPADAVVDGGNGDPRALELAPCQRKRTLVGNLEGDMVQPDSARIRSGRACSKLLQGQLMM